MGRPKGSGLTPAWDRFWSKVYPSGFCWYWTGSTDKSGYGRFGVETHQSPKLAHRYAYELLVGPIPDGMYIDHLCRNTRCVNPDHLEPVTPAENLNRIPNFGARKTHCPRGHEFTEDNVLYRSNGWRTCRECNRHRSKLAHIKRKEAKRNGTD